jgi:putative endonuclease
VSPPGGGRTVLPPIRKQPPLGPLGEELAARAYEESGARVLARNRRGPFGEIDLLVEDGEELVAVEVKTRTASPAGALPFGQPAEAVTGERIARLSRSLESLAAAFGTPRQPRRIDVVEVVLDRGRQLVDLRILKNVTG